MISRIANVVIFQAGWWMAILGGGSGYPWFGSVLVLGLVSVNISLSVNPRATVRTVVVVALFGTLLDSVLSAAGILRFADNPFAPWFCPPWLVAIWCLFATTLNSSLEWLVGRDCLTALVGGIFGPLSYAAGQAMGALSLGPSTLVAVTVLAALWSMLLPVLVRLAGIRERYA